jgi:hypothetical protein
LIVEPLSKLRPYIVGFPKNPQEMTRREAIAEFEEFKTRKPDILEYFQAVLGESGVRQDVPSRELLDAAGEWLVAQGRIAKARSPVPRLLGGDELDQDISVATMSACCYLGVLFGERLCEDTGASWTLVVESKRDADYHRAVIRPSKNRTQIEPIRLVMNFARRRLEDKKDQKTLGSFYDVWNAALSSRTP